MDEEITFNVDDTNREIGNIYSKNKKTLLKKINNPIMKL